MAGALPGTMGSSSKQRQPMCNDCEKSLPNQIVFDKIESIIRLMQDEQNGLPVKTAQKFMSKIPSVFTGIDLIQWMMRNLKLEDQQEAIHLANLIASHGYIFPIEDHTLSIRNDTTYYRFQTPCLWPSHNLDPENTDYAVYLCKRTMQGKARLELADYEAENLARLQKMFSRKWEFIFMQAESQAKVDKKRDKLERKVLDSQERAFWDVYRPVPGCVNTTELDIKKACRLSKSAKRCAECQKVSGNVPSSSSTSGSVTSVAPPPSPEPSSIITPPAPVTPEPPPMMSMTSTPSKACQVIEEDQEHSSPSTAMDSSDNQGEQQVEEVKVSEVVDKTEESKGAKGETKADETQETQASDEKQEVVVKTEVAEGDKSSVSQKQQQQQHHHGHAHKHHHHHHHPHGHHHHHHHHHHHSKQCPHHKHHQPQKLQVGEQRQAEAAARLEGEQVGSDASTTTMTSESATPTGRSSAEKRLSATKKRSMGSVDQFITVPTFQDSRRKSEETSSMGGEEPRPASACCMLGPDSSDRKQQHHAAGAQRKSSLNIMRPYESVDGRTLVAGLDVGAAVAGLGGGSKPTIVTSTSAPRKTSVHSGPHSPLKVTQSVRAGGGFSALEFLGSTGGEDSERHIGDLERELETLRLRLDRRIGGVKMSKVTQSYLSYFKQWAEYDPFITQPIPSNPWISDSTELWDSERQTKDVHCRRVRRWAFSLKELLNDPAGREQFHKFLEKEFSAENLKFWDAVQELKRVHQRDVARRVEAIWTEYLAQDANCPINIDSKSYETSKKNMAKNKNNRYIFDEAAGHVYQLMKNDSYPRYLRSDMYKDYKEASNNGRIKSLLTFLNHK